MKKETIAVLIGGISAEREVSLSSGKEVIDELKKSNQYRVLVYDPKTDLQKLIQDKDQIDVAMTILHGPYGEDGTIQGFLELLQIPYTHSGVLASALGMDKHFQKMLFFKNNILTPDYFILDQDHFKKQFDQIPRSFFQNKVVVKPNSNGSSYGVYIGQNQKEAQRRVKDAFSYGQRVMIEKYIKGTEITVGVLGDKALPVVEIVPPGEFFDLKSKYDGNTKEIVPARIPPEQSEEAQKIARKAHHLLGCRGVTRTDMIIKNSKIYVLEINTIPGITKESLIPKAAKAAGMTFLAFLEELIRLAKEGKDVSPKI